MSSITRWVLAHKRIVTVFWVALTVIGIASVNSATKALDQKFSVPGKEGWETNVVIADHFQGKGGDTAPIVPVVTVPAGETVSSPGSDGAGANPGHSGPKGASGPVPGSHGLSIGTRLPRHPLARTSSPSRASTSASALGSNSPLQGRPDPS